MYFVRNYLDHIAGRIFEWSQLQEAKYQASLLAAEVDQINKESDPRNQSAGSESPKDKKGSKSPKKSPKKFVSCCSLDQEGNKI